METQDIKMGPNAISHGYVGDVQHFLLTKHAKKTEAKTHIDG